MSSQTLFYEKNQGHCFSLVEWCSWILALDWGFFVSSGKGEGIFAFSIHLKWFCWKREPHRGSLKEEGGTIWGKHIRGLFQTFSGPGFCPMVAKSRLNWVYKGQTYHCTPEGTFLSFIPSSNRSTPVDRHLHLGYEGFGALKEGYVQVEDVPSSCLALFSSLVNSLHKH